MKQRFNVCWLLPAVAKRWRRRRGRRSGGSGVLSKEDEGDAIQSKNRIYYQELFKAKAGNSAALACSLDIR
jgi:hypothetical protein